MTRRAKAEFEIVAADRTSGVFGKVQMEMDALSRSARRIAVGVGAMGAALGAATVKAATHADSIAKAARASGFAAESYQELVFTMNEAGVTTEQTTSSLERFTKRIGEAANGTGAAAKEYERLGISLTDSDGRIRASEDVLNDVSAAMANMDTAAQRSASAAALFGREGIRMGLALADGPAVLEEYAQTARQLGLVLDESLLANAEAASDQIDRMQAIVSTQATAALANLFPVVISIGNAFAASSVRVREFFDFFNEDSELRTHGQIALVREQIAELMGEIETRRADRSQSIGIGLPGWSDAEGRRLTEDEVSERLDEVNALIEVQRALEGKLRAMQNENSGRIDGGSLQGDELGALGSIPGIGNPEANVERAQRMFDSLHEQRLAADQKEVELELYRRERLLADLEAQRSTIEEDNLLTAEMEAGFRTAKEEAIAASEARIVAIRKQSSDQQMRTEQSLQTATASLRSRGVSAAISLLSTLAGQSQSTQIALLALEKGKAIADVMIQSKVAQMRALAELGPVFGPPVAAKFAALGYANASLIAATGLAQGAASGGAGGSAGLSSVGGSFGADTSQPVALPGATQRVEEQDQNAAAREVVITLAGGDALTSALIDSIEAEISEGDRILIQPDSRQAAEIRAA